MNEFDQTQRTGRLNGLVRGGAAVAARVAVVSCIVMAGSVARAQEPSAWRNSWQGCGHFLNSQYCVGPDGTQTCTGASGGQVCRNRPWPWENRPATTSVGVDGTTPAYPYRVAGVAATGSVLYNVNNGNVDIGAGPFLGIPNALGVSVQPQMTYDRARAQELRDVQNWIAQRNNQLPTQPSQPNPTSFGGRPDSNYVPLEWRYQTAQHAYNPPADLVAPFHPQNTPRTDTRAQAPMATSPVIGSQGVGSGNAQQPSVQSPGFSQQDFQNQVDQTMRDFNRIADARAQPSANGGFQPGHAVSSPTTPVPNQSSSASRPSALVMPQNNDLPGSYYRIGVGDSVRYYDHSGNRISGPPQDTSPSTAIQTADSGRQNNVYNPYTGDQRPIGRQSATDIPSAADQSRRPSAAVGTSGNEWDAANSASRTNSQSSRPVDPQLPSVNRRQVGSQTPTASLRMPR